MTESGSERDRRLGLLAYGLYEHPAWKALLRALDKRYSKNGRGAQLLRRMSDEMKLTHIQQMIPLLKEYVEEKAKAEQRLAEVLERIRAYDPTATPQEVERTAQLFVMADPPDKLRRKPILSFENIEKYIGRQRSDVTAEAIRIHFGVSQATLNGYLTSLLRKGVIKRVRKGVYRAG